MFNPRDFCWFIENSIIFLSKILSISVKQIYLQFVVVKDNVEVNLSIWFQDMFEFHTLTEVMGKSAKLNNDVDVYVFFQCCYCYCFFYYYFNIIILLPEKNRKSRSPLKWMFIHSLHLNLTFLPIGMAKKGVKFHFKDFMLPLWKIYWLNTLYNMVILIKGIGYT